MEYQASVKIQQAARVRDAKKELANKRAAKIAKDKEEKGAATKLQSLQRGRKGRKRYTTPLAHARTRTRDTRAHGQSGGVWRRAFACPL